LHLLNGNEKKFKQLVYQGIKFKNKALLCNLTSLSLFQDLYYIRNFQFFCTHLHLNHMSPKRIISILLFFIFSLSAFAQDYDTCGNSGEEAWAGDTAAITAFLISCGRIDTTNYDEHGKKTKGKPHHQKIVMKLNSGKELHNDSIYFVAESMPSFPGGDEGLIKYLKEHIHYPPAARANHTEGKVVVSFIVDRNGALTNIKIIRGIGNGCEVEAIRVLSTMPKWSPGKVRGKEVRVQMNLPVKFQLNG